MMMAAFWLGDVLNLRLQESLTIIWVRSAASQKVPDPAQELSAHARDVVRAHSRLPNHLREWRLPTLPKLKPARGSDQFSCP